MVALWSAGISKALCTTAGSFELLSAAPRVSFALPSISPRRRVNTAPTRSSRLPVARSASVFRAMAKTSSLAVRVISLPSLA